MDVRSENGSYNYLAPGCRLVSEKHAKFVQRFAEEQESYLSYATEHFRMSGVYWGATTLHLIGQLDLLPKEEVVGWVLSCQHADGGFGGSERHDPHLLYTLSAVQILATFGELAQIDPVKVASYVSRLQQPDGSFWGDEGGEVDTRFSLCAIACCSLLQKLSVINTSTAARFISSCQNFDGGFGVVPGAESHAGQVFTCVAALAITQNLDLIDSDRLCWWLSERQTSGGGLNGRPEKLEDVCYSWWCLSALKILDRLHWIDKTALTKFVLGCQDEADGGISDRAEDECDVFHTFFGIAALSLLGHPGLEAVDPAYAMPASVVKRCLGEGACQC